MHWDAHLKCPLQQTLLISTVHIPTPLLVNKMQALSHALQLASNFDKVEGRLPRPTTCPAQTMRKCCAPWRLA
jgi:hypothetical protein